MSQTFTVTVVGSHPNHKFAIDGVTQATLNLIEDNTYRFDQADSSNSSHPLRLSITSDGTHGGGIEYTTGVTTSGTPGSGGAYTEITVAVSAPTLYYYCSAHSGMGGTANTASTSEHLQGWGRQTWGSGAWGEYAPVAATGDGLTSSTAAPASITGDCNITLTGVYGTSTAGDATAEGLAVVTVVQSQTLTSNTNDVASVTGTASVSPTAAGLTSSLGDETVDTAYQSGWGRGFNADTGTEIGWGDNLWGTLESSYALTGASATTSTGDMTFQGDVDITVTGQSATVSEGSILTSIFVTGVQAATSIGSYSITADATITVVAASEPELDASTGDVVVEISPTVEPAGTLLTGSLGSSTITGECNVTLTAAGLTSSLGDETVTGNVNVDADGNGLTSYAGDATASADLDITVTGNGLTSYIGDAGQISGYLAPNVSATASIGTLNISTDVVFTAAGNSATISTGTLRGTFWQEVDDSQTAIWVEVDKAA